jgi:hypothetical protein
MLGRSLQGQKRALVIGLSLAGLLLAAPRHAWAQG